MAVAARGVEKDTAWVHVRLVRYAPLLGFAVPGEWPAEPAPAPAPGGSRLGGRGRLTGAGARCGWAAGW